MSMGYEELLKRGREALPESVKITARFEIPKVVGHVQGSKTIISNFLAIADAFNRDASHLLKFIQRELATPAQIEGQRLVMGRKLSSALINAKVQFYADTFVLCPDCKRPDTKLVKEDKVLFLKCTACGAKHPIRAKI